MDARSLFLDHVVSHHGLEIMHQNFKTATSVQLRDEGWCCRVSILRMRIRSVTSLSTCTYPWYSLVVGCDELTIDRSASGAEMAALVPIMVDIVLRCSAVIQRKIEALKLKVPARSRGSRQHLLGHPSTLKNHQGAGCAARLPGSNGAIDLGGRWLATIKSTESARSAGATFAGLRRTVLP